MRASLLGTASLLETLLMSRISSCLCCAHCAVPLLARPPIYTGFVCRCAAPVEGTRLMGLGADRRAPPQRGSPQCRHDGDAEPKMPQRQTTPLNSGVHGSTGSCMENASSMYGFGKLLQGPRQQRGHYPRSDTHGRRPKILNRRDACGRAADRTPRPASHRMGVKLAPAGIVARMGGCCSEWASAASDWRQPTRHTDRSLASGDGSSSPFRPRLSRMQRARRAPVIASIGLSSMFRIVSAAAQGPLRPTAIPSSALDNHGHP